MSQKTRCLLIFLALNLCLFPLPTQAQTAAPTSTPAATSTTSPQSAGSESCKALANTGRTANARYRRYQRNERRAWIACAATVWAACILALTLRYIRKTYLRQYNYYNQVRAAQKCPPPPRDPNACSPTKVRDNIELEKLAKQLNEKVICGDDLKKDNDRLAGGHSLDPMEKCDCEIADSDKPDPAVPDSVLSQLSPEQLAAFKDAQEKIDGDSPAADDAVKKLDDTFGSFATTDSGAPNIASVMPNKEHAAAVQALENLSDEQEKRDKAKETGRESFSPDTGGGGGITLPKAPPAQDTSQFWGKLAKDKKNAINDNPRRGIFAQVNGRYAVETKNYDKFLDARKGAYQSVKPEDTK